MPTNGTSSDSFTPPPAGAAHSDPAAPDPDVAGPASDAIPKPSRRRRRTPNSPLSPDEQPPTIDPCRGPEVEPLAHQHSTELGLASHLTLFLAHRSPLATIRDHGIPVVLQALQEIPLDGTITNPAGWLTWRCRRIAEGAAPIPDPVDAMRILAKEERRAAHQKAYDRRYPE